MPFLDTNFFRFQYGDTNAGERLIEHHAPEIILNVGSAQGVVQGMVFSVFASVEEVKDPDSGETLGAWEAVKGYVQAAHPQERLAVRRTYAATRAASLTFSARGPFGPWPFSNVTA